MGDKKGVNFTFKDTINYITEFGKKLPDSKPSMLQDVEAKRFSEVGAINGMVVNLGKELNIETPYNTAVSSIIISKESEYK